MALENEVMTSNHYHAQLVDVVGCEVIPFETLANEDMISYHSHA
jgi:hypothetical protein